MMNCLDFRRRVGAEPFAADEEIRAHRRDCAACARYQNELQAMDGLIARALAVVPTRIRKQDAASAPARATPVRRRIFAVAASIVVGLSIGLALLIGAPRTSIAREVIDHMLHEPGTMAASAPIAPGTLAGVLEPEGTRLRPGLGDVTFAARCVHDGRVVPHLVVRMPEGPVTVFLLRHREISEPIRIEDEGFNGVVLPAPRGSIAIVGRGIENLDGVAKKVFEAVDWGA
ncbi:MAG: DUF3379 family protein [Steroidobacteraceae bacterium]